MKFLCVPCDSPMKLQTVSPPEGGSLSVVYACPECGYEMAMLTNAYETQIVQSLGVRIGPSTAVGAGPEGGGGVLGSTSSSASGTSCPFVGMIPSAERTVENSRNATSNGESNSLGWTAAAEARLANIPAFVRPMARTGIERFARERGLLEVDERVLDEAREFFGM